MSINLSVESAVLTHPGRKRSHNEDFVAFFEPDDPQERERSGCLYLVADGVGGAARGERASQYAAEKVLYAYYHDPDPDLGARLRRAMRQAGNEIYQHMERTGDGARMATTLVAAAIRGNSLVVANVGDSRAYLIRDSTARQITRDHTIAGELLRDGEIDEFEAQHLRGKNRLTRSLGGEMDVTVDVFGPLPLQPGDRVLLCTDGLGRYALQQDIAALAVQGSPEQVAHRCIDYANERGGADNISVAVIAVSETPAYAAPTVRRRGRAPQPVDWDAMVTVPAIRPPLRRRRRRSAVQAMLILSAAALILSAAAIAGAVLMRGWLVSRASETQTLAPSPDTPTPEGAPAEAPPDTPTSGTPTPPTDTPTAIPTPTETPTPTPDFAFEFESGLDGWRDPGQNDYISANTTDGALLITAKGPLGEGKSPFWFFYVPDSPLSDYVVETRARVTGNCPNGGYFGLVVRYNPAAAEGGAENGYGLEINCSGKHRVTRFSPNQADEYLTGESWLEWSAQPPSPLVLRIQVQDQSFTAWANGQQLGTPINLGEGYYRHGGIGLYVVTPKEPFTVAFDYVYLWVFSD